MKDAKVLKKNPKMVTRKIGGQTILMPLCENSEDIGCIYTLNELADRIWELIDGRHTLDKIKKIVFDEYDFKEEELAEFINDLKEIKAVS